MLDFLHEGTTPLITTRGGSGPHKMLANYAYNVLQCLIYPISLILYETLFLLEGTHFPHHNARERRGKAAANILNESGFNIFLNASIFVP